MPPNVYRDVVRAAYLGPAVQFLTNDACVVLFMIQSADRLILCLSYVWIKLRGSIEVTGRPPHREKKSGREENNSETVVDQE